MQKIAITGASGFVGQALKKHLESQGYEIVVIPRSEIANREKLAQYFEGNLGVINLSGANIINRWTKSYKKQLYSSRIETTKAIVDAMELCTSRPQCFISTSAIGIYAQDKIYNEQNAKYSDDFLANLCKDWETEAANVQRLGIRSVIFRFGVVLGRGGGALQKMLTPFKLGLGGTIGNGSQPFSFIHIDDLMRVYSFVLEDTNLRGVFNATAPIPTTNKGLTIALSRALNRPAILPVPSFALKLIMGEGASVLTQGQSVTPTRLLDAGFKFEFFDIDKAIRNSL